MSDPPTHDVYRIRAGATPGQTLWDGPSPAKSTDDARTRAELGIPPDFPIATVISEVWAFEQSQHRQGYTVFIHGLPLLPGTIFPCQVDGDQMTWLLSNGLRFNAFRERAPLVHHPCAWLDDDGELTLSLNLADHEQIYRAGRIKVSAQVLVISMKLFYKDSAVFAERRWSPELGTQSFIGGLEKSNSPEEVERARKSFVIFDKELSRRTPAGGQKPVTDAAAFEEAVNYGLQWLIDHPGAEPSHFTSEELRKRRATGPDGMKKWFKAKGFRIRQVQREMARRLQTPSR